MNRITTFAAAAALALSMAGTAGATAFVNVATSGLSGNNQISWTGSAVGGGTLTISNLATFINFDDSVYNDGAGENAILSFTGTSAANAGNLLTGGGNFTQQELTGTFEFRSAANTSIVLLSGTFSHYWLQGTVGSSGSGNITSSIGTANFASDVVDLSFVKHDNFQFGFNQTHPAFGITDGTLNNFQGNNVTGSFGGVVPEPATWALMIAGFGGAGAMLRRRKMAVA